MTTLSSALGDEAPQRATMRDVAALAGVSLKTVSRVTNGEPGVSAQLTDRVTAAAEQLDFRPNLTASSLRRADRKTSTLGLLVDDVANPFFSEIHRGVEDVARERGVAVMAASMDRRTGVEAEVVATFASRRVDGLILVPTAPDQAYLETELRSGWPVVCVDRVPKGASVDCVLADNRAAAANATRHLLQQGHRRIAFLGDAATLMTAQERLAGFREAMAEAGAPIEPRWIGLDVHSRQDAEHTTREILSGPDRPTALFTAQNYVTMGACRALHRMGLQSVVALTGFDDFPMADVLQPGVSVVEQDARRMGREAAEVLFARMDGATGPVMTKTVPCTFIPRGSGEIPPG